MRHAMIAITMAGLAACLPAVAAQVEIVNPLPEEVVHDNNGTIIVDVKLEPPLDAKRGQSLRIVLDGQVVSPDAPGPNFTVLGVERGQHWVQALLVDGKGQTLAVSPTVNFTVWQASVNAPPRKKKQ